MKTQGYLSFNRVMFQVSPRRQPLDLMGYTPQTSEIYAWGKIKFGLHFILSNVNLKICLNRH